MINAQELSVTGDEANKSGRSNRRAGVETYPNMLRILFALRDAPLSLLPDQTTYAKVMTAEQICRSLCQQDRPPSLTTVRKYLRQMENQTPSQVEVVASGKGGVTYWRLKESSPLHKSGLSDYEAAMVCLASQLLEPLLPPHLRQHIDVSRQRAEHTLINARPFSTLQQDSPLWMLKLVNRIWVEKPPPVSPKVQDAVFEALRSKRKLRIGYLSVERKRQRLDPVMIDVDPVRLVQHGDARLYLIASSLDQTKALGSQTTENEKLSAYRRFALHRITEAEILERQTTDYELLEQVIDSQPGFGWEGKIRLVANISADITVRLEESPLNETQIIKPTSDAAWSRLEVDIDMNWELRWWILSHGDQIIVVAPSDLRRDIAARLAAANAAYQGT
jgi:predicted DNA-binding transcriptional regulator YafY